MRRRLTISAIMLVLFCTVIASATGIEAQPANGAPAQDYLSPCALAASPDGKSLYVACATAGQVLVIDLASRSVTQRVSVPASPSGLAITKDGSRLYVTCAAPSSTLCIIDTAQTQILHKLRVGHTAMSPVLSPDEKTLYVCNRFNNDLSFIDLLSNQEIRRVPVSREPVAAAITPDGKLLLVANHLYNTPTDRPGTAATVSILDAVTGSLIKQIKLARGSNLLRGIAVSPDGQFAAVTHLLARYYIPTAEVTFGAINANALSLLDLRRLQWYRFVYLDYSGRGAANPWALTWTPDGKSIVVTHAGTHELSLVEAPLLPQKAIRSRNRIPVSGNGPRAVAVVGSHAYIANYFTDNISIVDLNRPDAEDEFAEDELLELGPVREPSLARQGEIFFNDGRLCFQGWQSCASCHDCDARMDGINWDLFNDGPGNPKNAKSLIWSHQTPPAMWMGVRDSAEVAVRAGLRHILFTKQPESVPAAIDAWLKSLQPIPGPYLVNNYISPGARRGQELFMSPATGCARCHPPPYFTDRKTHDVGTRGRYDRPSDCFDTPTLVELWRTGPYLHDGSGQTLQELLTTRNTHDLHGRTSQLTPKEIKDLADYLSSL